MHFFAKRDSSSTRLTNAAPSAELAESIELWRSWVRGKSDGPFLVVPRGATLPAFQMIRDASERAF